MEKIHQQVSRCSPEIVNDLDLLKQPIVWYKDLIPSEYGYDSTQIVRQRTWKVCLV